VPFADITFGQSLLLILEIFLFVAWLWILFAIIGDLFRNHEQSGWSKALWVLFLIFIPFLAGLIYLIVHGDGMRQRMVQAQAEQKHQMDDYIRQQAGSGSTADELHKLNDLKDKGAISAEEFDKAKAKLLA